jgi:hypothetical protein
MNLAVGPFLRVLFVYLSVVLSADCSFFVGPNPIRGDRRRQPNPFHIPMKVGVLRRNASWLGESLPRWPASACKLSLPILDVRCR